MGFLVLGLLGDRIVVAQAYQDPCHRWRRCPSEHHPSICGDKGRWDPCLDHECCLGHMPRTVITFHCCHRHPLKAVDLQIPLQGSELKVPSWSD
jgi:hypothetical protein